MSRTLNKEAFGPPGICDACGKPCCVMQHVGIQCYHCHAGTFMHRSLWLYTWLDGELIATPREDLTEADLVDQAPCEATKLQVVVEICTDDALNHLITSW